MFYQLTYILKIDGNTQGMFVLKIAGFWKLQ